MKKSALFALAAVFGTTGWADPPQHIDVNGLGGKGTEMIDDVVVPVPSEIFLVLDKIGRPGWPEVLRPTKEAAKPSGSPEQISLLLGTVIAEGFVAVEAENTEEVKKIGRSVLSLSSAIGVKKAVIKRSNAIIENADKKDWKKVRNELDGALKDVKGAMIELHSNDLAQLVSLGGWLRGTEALTMVVLKSYKPEGAELLHQPMLLKYFKRQIDAVKSKKDPLVGKIRQGLIDIEPKMAAGEADISEATVKEIQEISSGLIKDINQKPTP